MKASLHGGRLDGRTETIDKIEPWLSLGIIVCRVIQHERDSDGHPKSFKVAMPKVGTAEEVEIINYYLEGRVEDYEGNEEELNYHWRPR